RLGIEGDERTVVATLVLDLALAQQHGQLETEVATDGLAHLVADPVLPQRVAQACDPLPLETCAKRFEPGVVVLFHGSSQTGSECTFQGNPKLGMHLPSSHAILAPPGEMHSARISASDDGLAFTTRGAREHMDRDVDDSTVASRLWPLAAIRASSE